MFEKFDISNFDKYKEDNRMEVKSAKGGLPYSLWETYSSFANSYGGIIILGVIENGDGTLTTSGLKDVDIENLKRGFWNTVNNETKVSINLLIDKDVQSYELGGDHILVINVPMATRSQKPVYINNNLFSGTYKRNGDGDFHCSKAQIKEMLRDQDESFDSKIVPYLGLDSLCMDTIRKYRGRQKLFKPTLPWDGLDVPEYLEMIGASRIGEDGKYHPTYAGLLMFGYEHRITYEFPEYFLDYREQFDSNERWTDRVQSQSGEWPGNLYEFYFIVYYKLIRSLKIPFKLVGGDRIDDTPAHQALREVLANTLIHADYKMSRGIVIIQNDKEIVFSNPGSITVGKYQMVKGGVSDPRNLVLMKLFNLVDIGEKAGSGIPKLFKVWHETGYVQPKIQEDNDSISRTTITLPILSKVVKTADSVKTLKEQLKDILRERPTTPLNEITATLGVGKRTVSRLTKELTESGEIERIGNKKTGEWRIIK